MKDEAFARIANGKANNNRGTRTRHSCLMSAVPKRSLQSDQHAPPFRTVRNANNSYRFRPAYAAAYSLRREFQSKTVTPFEFVQSQFRVVEQLTRRPRLLTTSKYNASFLLYSAIAIIEKAADHFDEH